MICFLGAFQPQYYKQLSTYSTFQHPSSFYCCSCSCFCSSFTSCCSSCSYSGFSCSCFCSPFTSCCSCSYSGSSCSCSCSRSCSYSSFSSSHLSGTSEREDTFLHITNLIPILCPAQPPLSLAFLTKPLCSLTTTHLM